MSLQEFFGGRQDFMMDEADVRFRSWLTAKTSTGSKLDSGIMGEGSPQETETRCLLEFDHWLLFPGPLEIGASDMSTQPLTGHLTATLDSPRMEDVPGTYPSQATINKCVPSRHNNFRDRFLPPTILDGSPSPIEMLPSPIPMAHSKFASLAQRGHQNENSNTNETCLKPLKSVASEAAVGLGVSLPSSHPLKMPSVSSSPGPCILPFPTSREVHSPTQGTELRSSPCDDGECNAVQSPLGQLCGGSVTPLRLSPVIETLPEPHQLSAQAYECTKLGPTVTHTPWTACDTFTKARSPVSSSPTPRYKRQSYAKPSSSDTKFSPGQTARKGTQSRTIRTLENTPPTPKSPLTMEKVTVSPFSVATNSLGAIHGYSQSPFQTSPVTCAKGPFTSLFSDEEFSPRTRSPLHQAMPTYKAASRSYFTDHAGGARGFRGTLQMDDTMAVQAEMPSCAKIIPSCIAVAGDIA